MIREFKKQNPPYTKEDDNYLRENYLNKLGIQTKRYIEKGGKQREYKRKDSSITIYKTSEMYNINVQNNQAVNLFFSLIHSSIPRKNGKEVLKEVRKKFDNNKIFKQEVT